MKLTFIIALIFVAVNSSFAQPWFIKHPDLGSSSDYIYDMVNASDGGYVFIGTAGDYDDNNNLKTNVLLGKINDDGDTLWTKRYGELIGRSEGYAITATSDGGYIAAGKKAGETPQVNTAWLFKFNSAGDTVWTKEFENAIFYDVIITSKDEIAVAGINFQPGNNRQSLLMITDIQGNVIDENSVGGPYYEEARALVELESGNFILSGSTNGQGAGGFDTYFVKFNNEAEALWDTTYGSANTDRVYDMILDSNGDLVVAGSTNRNSDLEHLMLKIDTLGNLIWEKTYSSSVTNTLYDIQESKRGGYISVGGYYSGSTGLLPVMLRTDMDGTQLWLQQYDEAGFTETFVFTALETSNNDIYILGSGYNASFIRTDGQGTFTSAQDISGDFEFSVFPNPTNGSLEVQAKPGLYDFSIYNSLGLQLQQWQNQLTGNLSIDLSAYPAGMYFINIRQGEKSQTLKLIRK